ncbi:DUF5071 domain-containing protein [Chitinophaga rhizophila]|uniref:DUF5071 domain-containing protein n=1 Tax=Chitinophaga rhizophila TaxID=2866212 RepID=A0ABS7G5N2_9BACT|nr:DUF5071 domain-containing protein [Chitinophaga rhizophila]MBW8682711.1 DUF5071 domain-containing protein [Chitinophaga rhizophila]
MKRHIPKQKLDMEAVAFLQTCDFEDIRQDVPELLEWLQDLNWWVGDGIGEYLRPYANDIKSEILAVLHTNDDQWKYGVMICILAVTPVKLDDDYMPVLGRIMASPTPSEKEWELELLAADIMDKQR